MQGLGLLALLRVGDVGKVLADGYHDDTGRDGVDTDVFPFKLLHSCYQVLNRYAFSSTAYRRFIRLLPIKPAPPIIEILFFVIIVFSFFYYFFLSINVFISSTSLLKVRCTSPSFISTRVLSGPLGA